MKGRFMSEQELEHEMLKQKLTIFREELAERQASVITLALTNDTMLIDTVLTDIGIRTMFINLLIYAPKYKRIMTEALDDYDTHLDGYDYQN